MVAWASPFASIQSRRPRDGSNVAIFGHGVALEKATAYRPGTSREKLFGCGPRLPETHPAHRYRDIEAVKRVGHHAVTAE